MSSEVNKFAVSPYGLLLPDARRQLFGELYGGPPFSLAGTLSGRTKMNRPLSWYFGRSLYVFSSDEVREIIFRYFNEARSKNSDIDKFKIELFLHFTEKSTCGYLTVTSGYGMRTHGERLNIVATTDFSEVFNAIDEYIGNMSKLKTEIVVGANWQLYLANHLDYLKEVDDRLEKHSITLETGFFHELELAAATNLGWLKLRGMHNDRECACKTGVPKDITIGVLNLLLENAVSAIMRHIDTATEKIKLEESKNKPKPHCVDTHSYFKVTMRQLLNAYFGDLLNDSVLAKVSLNADFEDICPDEDIVKQVEFDVELIQEHTLNN